MASSPPPIPERGPPPVPAAGPPPVPTSAPHPVPAAGPPPIPTWAPHPVPVPGPPPPVPSSGPPSESEPLQPVLDTMLPMPYSMPPPPVPTKPPQTQDISPPVPVPMAPAPIRSHPVYEDATAISHEVDDSSPLLPTVMTDGGDPTAEGPVEHNVVPSSVVAHNMFQHPPTTRKSENWLPPGAVLTALNFNAKPLKSSNIAPHNNLDSSAYSSSSHSEGHTTTEYVTHHVKMPSELEEETGSIVKARFPFHGNPEMLQMSFRIGDEILILQKEDRWSWGRVVKTGEEGFFPHTYIKGAYQPLPGIHKTELSEKLLMRRKKLEEDEKRNSASSSHYLEGGVMGTSSESLRTQTQTQQSMDESLPSVPMFDAVTLLAKAPVNSDLKHMPVSHASDDMKDKLSTILSSGGGPTGHELGEKPAAASHQADLYNTEERMAAGDLEDKKGNDVYHVQEASGIVDPVKDDYPFIDSGRVGHGRNASSLGDGDTTSITAVNKAPPPPIPPRVAEPEEQQSTRGDHLQTGRVTGSSSSSNRNGTLETEQVGTNSVEAVEHVNSGCKCSVS